MSQSRPVAVVRAPIPEELVYTANQRHYFYSPAKEEKVFQELFFKDISQDYLDGINAVLREIADACDQVTDKPVYHDGMTEVIRARVRISSESLSLTCVSVRPCFEGHGMLALFVYQLVKAARKNQIPCVNIDECCDKTVAVLEHLFGTELVIIPVVNSFPTCRISNLWEVSAEQLGLSEKANCTGDAIKLKPSAFPTAAQVNDQAYVSTHYRTKYGARSSWEAGDIDDYTGAMAVEAEFQRTVGREPGPHYVAAINHMLAAFGREVADKKLYEQRDLEKQTDTVFMHLCLLSKDDVNTIELKRLHVRPCFRGNHIITLLIYQTIRFGLANNATRLVITCPHAWPTAMAKFGGSVFEKLQQLFYSISSESLGISDAIADDAHTVLKLNPAAFPPAGVLQHRRLRLLALETRFRSSLS